MSWYFPAMPPPKFLREWLSPHFAHPRGLVGRVVGWMMNRGNRNMNAFTVTALALAPSDHVLDIGFGGGLNLRPLAASVPSGRVIGVEPSETMLAAARSGFADLVEGGRLRLEAGTVEHLPLEDASVDAVCSANTIYFWKDPEAGAREIRRVLRSDGRVAITFLSGERMEANGFPRDVFRFWSPDEVVELFAKAGFADVRIARGPDPSAHWLSVVARRGA